ncbi:IBR domain-containing protein [Pleurotus pulmonarius]|nr:hypothetical protein EYR36_005758 [Pleurotus pulmonarius]
MSSTSATSPSRPSRHGRAKSTLTAFKPRPTDDEPLDDLELVRRFDRLTNSRLAKEKSSFHHLYVPDEAESRRPGLVDGVLWLAERIFVGPPPKPHKRQHSGPFTSHLTHEAREPEPESTSEPEPPANEPDEPELDGEEQLLRTSEEQGWQRCPAPDCGHMIELTEGCMRIKCRCGTIFCYGCGEPWKTCSCPLWDTPVADGGYRRSFDETGEELQDWELVGEDEPRVAVVVEQKPSVPEVKIPYYFEEGGITMPGGLFTMVPTRDDTDMIYSIPEAYTANPTNSNFPTPDAAPNSRHDDDLQFSESDANSPTREETTAQSPIGEASSSNQRDADLLGFEEEGDPFQTQAGLTPADLPPRYATFDQGALSGPSFPIPDTSASTSGLGYGHGYGFPTQLDGFEKWDGSPPLDDKKTSLWTEGAGPRTNSPPPDPGLLGADPEGEGDKSILGPSIRRTGTPLSALVDPSDQKKMSSIRGSARKRFSMDGTNGRKDLTEKDPIPRSNSAKVLEKEEDQAKMDEIRQNSKKLAGKAKAEDKPKVAAPAPKPAWAKKSPPAVAPPPSSSPAPKPAWGGKASKTPTPAPQTPARRSPVPDVQGGAADTEENKDEGTPSGVTNKDADPVNPADANPSENKQPVGEGAADGSKTGAENNDEARQEGGGENSGVEVPENPNEGQQDKTEEATLSGMPGDNADPPDSTTPDPSGDGATGDAEGDESKLDEGQATNNTAEESNNAEASDPAGIDTLAAGSTADDATGNSELGPNNGEATNDGNNVDASNPPGATISTTSDTNGAISAQRPEGSDGQAEGDASTTQVGDQGEGLGGTGGNASNPVSPNPDVGTPQSASASSPEIPTKLGGAQGGEGQDEFQPQIIKKKPRGGGRRAKK